MQLITYLGFTLVSVLIQFCVMDFINENIEVDKMIENVSTAHSKREMQAILTKISAKPHGLYYQTNKNAVTNVKSPFTLYKNASLVDMTTTEISSTILDWVYDENITTTEDTLQSTDMFTSTEFENITEITLFEKKSTTVKPNIIPKKTKSNTCHCDLMYKTCDINCCCDIDCSETDRVLFDCEARTCQEQETNHLKFCLADNECNNKMTSNFLENLFCISKTNLPDKRLTDIQFDEAAIKRSPKWQKHDRQELLYEFKRNMYRYNEPVWLSRNGSIFYADIPVIVTNHYCSGMKPIKFLRNENVKCVVKLQDLHMFQVLKNVEGSILSPMTNLTNSTVKVRYLSYSSPFEVHHIMTKHSIYLVIHTYFFAEYNSSSY
ncbi:tectonic-1 isoform X2 [Zerene cesonia]|uniref:tectonic-1 isoform X2 n=1 Tax=Zerene cesonia TaxID=33412 RepID=UPI0018E5431A|nr:tectonic-1 isoform X2 [Zerene cesonia]